MNNTGVTNIYQVSLSFNCKILFIVKLITEQHIKNVCISSPLVKAHKECFTPNFEYGQINACYKNIFETVKMIFLSIY